MENMETSGSVFETLLQAAREEKWDVVDAGLNNENITPDDFLWANIKGVKHIDDNVRDFSATVMMVSDLPINEGLQNILREQMMTDSYHIVRFRLAMALYKRGDRSTETMAVMQEAKEDKDVGEIANEYLQTK
jgi:hypothetical protein